MSKKQYVWLIRYGKTEYPLVEFDGPYNSDIDPKEGIHHAQCIANQIASSSASSSPSSPQASLPTKIYCSPFLRCVHTASIIAKKLGEEEEEQQQINIEEGLYEWLVPSLLIERSTNVRTYPQSMSEIQSMFGETINTEYKSLNPYNIDESNAKFSFPEDEGQLLARCKDTLNLILGEVECEGEGEGESIVIVAHAPCVQSIAFAMEEGVEDVKDSKLSKWPLGGITRFSRDVIMMSNNEESDGDGSNKMSKKCSYGKWTMDFYGITDHMPGEYKNGAGLWSLSCFDK